MNNGIRGEGVVFDDVQFVVDAYEDAPYISMVVDTSSELRILAANAHTRVLAGNRPLLGLPVSEALSDIERQGGVLDLYRRVARTGEAESVVGWHAQFQNPDGSVIPLWFDLTVTPCVAGGRTVAVVGRAWDVTERVVERQRVEAELRSVEASLVEAHEVVDTLQRVMLPDRVPVLPRLDVAAGYLLAAREQAAGGDWFDAVIRNDRVVLVVGDVVGHGVTASAAMGQLRAVLLDHLDSGDTITGAITALDRWAQRHPSAAGTTVCLLEIDPATGVFEYLTAGHPPPLVVLGTGENSRFLPPTGHGPLGGHRGLTTMSGALTVGELVVLYSDGLVELPGTTPVQGTMNLAAAVGGAVANNLLPVGASASTAQRVARQPIELLVRARGHADDVTVLVAHRREPAADLAVVTSTGEPAVARCRVALLGWLTALNVRADDRDAVLHAAGELVQNCVDHAYLDTAAGPIRLEASLGSDGSARVVVTDDGVWATPIPNRGRGLGLVLARDLVEHLDLDSTNVGTTATIRHRLHRDAGLLPLHNPPAGNDASVSADVWSHASEHGGQVGVSGPLDAPAARELAAALAIHTGPGQDRITLDLRDVTLLGSAAVHVIVQARRELPALRIVAPAGSVAQHVLALAAVTVVMTNEDTPHAPPH